MQFRYSQLVVAACFFWLPIYGVASISSFTQLCTSAPATVSATPDIDSAAFANCTEVNGSQTIHNVAPGANGNQVFDGSASVYADPSTYKVAVDLSLSNYQRSMYQYSSTSTIMAVFPTTADSTVIFDDSLTVTAAGGPGVYSLTYLFSLDGQVTSSDASLFQSSFCTSLFLPQGTGTVASRCLSNGQMAPQTFSFTYADLPFGAPITPTILISAAAYLDPLYSYQVGTALDSVVTGSAHADFGNTVHLSAITVTDAQGAPIPGITISSDSGFSYPLNPANTATPEPAGFSAVGLILLGVAALRQRLVRR